MFKKSFFLGKIEKAQVKYYPTNLHLNNALKKYT